MSAFFCQNFPIMVKLCLSDWLVMGLNPETASLQMCKGETAYNYAPLYSREERGLMALGYIVYTFLINLGFHNIDWNMSPIHCNCVESIKSCCNKNSSSMLWYIEIIESENVSILKNIGGRSTEGSGVHTSELSINQSWYYKLWKWYPYSMIDFLGKFLYFLRCFCFLLVVS